MDYTTEKLPDLLQATHIRHGKSGRITQLLIDSRLLQQPEYTLFFAIRGERRDGHDYIAALYEEGVRHFVVEYQPAGPFAEANFYQVAHTAKALQQLAAAHRQQFRIPIVGITGSNGKTIVKEWLFQLLHPSHRICRSPKSYNSQIGLPLSVWGLKPVHELGLFEAGISQAGEMGSLADLLRCDIGIFTHLGAAHDEGFSSREQKLQEKLQLFRYAERVIYRSGQAKVDAVMQALGRPLFRWSTTDGQAELQVRWPGSHRCELIYQGSHQSVRLPFTDEASFENAMHGAALMLYLGHQLEEVAERLPRLEAVGMRLERSAGVNGCLIINDSYNADLDGLEAALSPLGQLQQYHKRTAILSDVLQSGLPNEQLYRQVARLLQRHQVDRVVGIGESIPQLQQHLPAAVEQAYYQRTVDFLQQPVHHQFEREAVLVKGARPFAFERIARRLAEKVHQTTLEVDLSALLQNVRIYQRRLRPGTRMAVMVKAAAYGLGSLEVARALEFHQVDYLAVAYADEGVELREGGISLPIMVLNPEEAVFDTMLRYELEPEIYSLRLLRQFAAFAEGKAERFPIHLKLDTGMHRLGFSEAELPQAIELLKAYTWLQPRTAFSHLAGSGEAEHDGFTHQQYQRYHSMWEQLSAALPEPPIRHLLNSSGITRFPQYQLDMVRLGIGAYGIDPAPEMQEQLHSVLSLRARISQIKTLPPGATVGYSRAGQMPEGGRIATVSIGYADGLPRAVSKGGYALSIHGQRAPIVGNVCMDMCMVDITAIPKAEEGDEVIVFGPSLPVWELARAIGTIPYEVFTAISPRVSRVYIQD